MAALVAVAGLLVLIIHLAQVRWRPFLYVVPPVVAFGQRLGLPRAGLTLLDSDVLLVPLIALCVGFSVWRVRRRGAVGFRFGALDWSLGLGMVVLSTALAVLRNRLFGIPGGLGSLIPLSLWALPLLPLQALQNGLYEETLFRGYVLPQLASLLRRPWLAFLVMIALFDAMHLPQAYLIYHAHIQPWRVVVQMAFPIQPTGLVFGYLYWRTRSLVPGIVVHTYTTLWAFPFMG